MKNEYRYDQDSLRRGFSVLPSGKAALIASLLTCLLMFCAVTAPKPPQQSPGM